MVTNQYQTTDHEKIRLSKSENPGSLLPKTDDSRFEKIERNLISLQMMIEKLRRDNARLKDELSEVHEYLRNRR